MGPKQKFDDRFIDLSTAKRVWAIPAIQGRHEDLFQLHEKLLERLEPGDRVIYLGGIIGGGDTRAVLAEIFRFRRVFLARPPLTLPHDIVYLRGQQEEMWNKLLQIHFAPNPRDLLTWMFERGVEQTLASYGQTAADAFAAANDGMVGLSRWTSLVKAAVQATPGHADWFKGLRRFATTGQQGCLFVHAGLNPREGLDNQKDAFWWETNRFSDAASGFEDFQRIVRGFDPKGRGWNEEGHCITLDSRPEMPLETCCFNSNGLILSKFSAS